ncbi:MAG: NAD(P)/FAD-dependent oxidoreductase, partial [Saprospiraceae bacterium]|nr:NAD(P)/FAD-dependent oxidoreductase [Saprospiraceae bacterium]
MIAEHRIVIVGAGPAGLAVAGRMRQAGLDFHILEKSHQVADRWHHHYDRLHLHTIKRLSHLPHLPFPDSYPTYVSRAQLIAYLEEYTRHFAIQPQFGTEINAVRKLTDGGWYLDSNRGAVRARHVIIATGVNNWPYRPHWRGQEAFNGEIMHSIDYRNPRPFLGRRVLVVGMGNTGAEIALDLAEHSVPTWISVRGRSTSYHVTSTDARCRKQAGCSPGCLSAWANGWGRRCRTSTSVICPDTACNVRRSRLQCNCGKRARRRLLTSAPSGRSRR